MRKVYWVVVYLVVLLLLFSCTQKPATGPISVKVNVNLPAGTTVKHFEPRLNGYISDVSVITLTVKNGTGETVLSTQTTNKTNPSFTFTLPSAGKYSFYVEAKRADSSKVFAGQKENVDITTGNNNVSLDAMLVNGTIRTNIQIDDTVWSRYNVTSTTLEFKKDIEEKWTTRDLTISAASTTHDESVYPSMYTLRFKIKLSAKDQYTTPPSWDNELNPAVVTVNVDPDRIRNVTFKVVFDSQRNEPVVIAVVTQITLPYVPEVTGLTAVWNKTTNELAISWNYSESNATFYVYKEIKDTDGNTTYEFVGNTQDKNYTISNFDQTEYDRISGIAINAVLDNKESGLTILAKEQFQQLQAPDAPTGLTGNYEDYSQKLILSWNAAPGTDVKYKVYKKLISDADFTLVQDNITATTTQINLPLSDWNNLDKIAVSAYNNSGESAKTELTKSSITLLDFAGGTGTESDPYLIGNARQLQNVGTSAYLTAGKYFKLIDDIDLNGVNWTPIGTYSSNLATSAFVGVFDGNGHKIKNLTYNDTTKTNVGVFGYIYNATVKNLIIENANITAKQYVGALSGGAKNSTVEKVGVRNSTITAVNTNNAYVGGLIGDVNDDTSSSNAMVIRQCFASNVTVSAPNYDNARAGGLLGRFYANTVETGIVENCYAIGTVNFKSTASSNIGGLIGLLSTNTSSGGKAKVVNCYAAVAPGTTGASKWKGFIGGDYSPATTTDSGNNYFDKDVAQETTGSLNSSLQTGKTTSEMKTDTPYDSTWLVSIWKFVSNQYPTLQWEF